ncbi:MAG: uncharacterized protein PWP73_48 [Methanococcus sp.]|nr:uncharacterized protein [Methanococcus sp.]
MSFEVTFDGMRYSCVNCAYCCSCKNWRVFLSYFDMMRLNGYENYIEKSNSNYEHVLALRNGKCGLIENNLCRIQLEKSYDTKPAMCRLFPFSFMVKWNGDLLLILKHYCSGVQVGKCSKKTIKHAIECCEELYHDQLSEFSLDFAERSDKTSLNEKTEICWEERAELGKYFFKIKKFDSFSEKYSEIFSEDISDSIEKLKSKNSCFDEKTQKLREKETLRYMYELNKREHFRKMSFKKELDNLINVGIIIDDYKDLLKGEGAVDSKLLLN